MDQQPQPAKEKEKDDKKPGIPSLRETTQKPQFKIKGLKAGQSVLERLKQFKKKDLAFILAGLGVLFMAPLAEHFLMSPDNGGGFQEGWNVKPGAGGLGSGGSPFEPGAGGVAPGDLAGGGSDVITPLNVRDPSALIMGPGATSQPPAMSSNAGQAPASNESSSWKDALAQSAAHAAGAATHAATPLPPLPQLSGGGLRGLGAVSGGGGASYTLPAISAANVPNRGGGGGSLGLARGTNGYAGPAGPRSLTNAGGGLEALKKAAGEAGSDFNRSSAGSGLEHAAATNMGSGSDFGGAGQGSAGMGQDKAAGQSSSKDSKSEGESLAFLAAKANQDHAIDLKWKLIEKQAMLWPDLKQKMIESLAMKPIDKFSEQIADMMSDAIGGKSSQVVCDNKDGSGPLDPISKSDIASLCDGVDAKDKKFCWDGKQIDFVGGSSNGVYGVNCHSVGGGGGGSTSSTPGGNDVPTLFGKDGTLNSSAYGDTCKTLKTESEAGQSTTANSQQAASNPKAVTADSNDATVAGLLLDGAQYLASGSDGFQKAFPGSDDAVNGDCIGAKALANVDGADDTARDKSVQKRFKDAQKDFTDSIEAMNALLDASQGVAGDVVGKGDGSDGIGKPVDDMRQAIAGKGDVSQADAEIAGVFSKEGTALNGDDWKNKARAMGALDKDKNQEYHYVDNANKLYRADKNFAVLTGGAADEVVAALDHAKDSLTAANNKMGSVKDDGARKRLGDLYTSLWSQLGSLKMTAEDIQRQSPHYADGVKQAAKAETDAEAIFTGTEQSVFKQMPKDAPDAGIQQLQYPLPLEHLKELADNVKSGAAGAGDAFNSVVGQQGSKNAWQAFSDLKDSIQSARNDIAAATKAANASVSGGTAMASATTTGQSNP